MDSVRSFGLKELVYYSMPGGVFVLSMVPHFAGRGGSIQAYVFAAPVLGFLLHGVWRIIFEWIITPYWWRRPIIEALATDIKCVPKEPAGIKWEEFIERWQDRPRRKKIYTLHLLGFYYSAKENPDNDGRCEERSSGFDLKRLMGHIDANWNYIHSNSTTALGLVVAALLYLCFFGSPWSCWYPGILFVSGIGFFFKAWLTYSRNIEQLEADLVKVNVDLFLGHAKKLFPESKDGDSRGTHETDQ